MGKHNAEKPQGQSGVPTMGNKNKPTKVTGTAGSATYASSRMIQPKGKAVGPIIKPGKHAAKPGRHRGK
jgi:hypothetical protein